MEWAKVKELIGDAAPVVGTLIGGPVGTAIGGLVSSALGVENTPDAVAAAISTNPDALLKLKQLEADHATDLRKLCLQQLQIEASDRASARSLVIEGKDNTARNLAYFYTGMLLLVISAHIFLNRTFDQITAQIVANLEGVLIAMVLGAKEFFFGSSSAAVKQADAITKYATTD